MIRTRNLELLYPNLRDSNYRIRHNGSPLYNCLSLANGDRTRWWHYKRRFHKSLLRSYWPPDVPQNWEVETLVLLFRNRGYEICKSAEYEDGFQKVALYMNVDLKASHVAIMAQPEFWLSKLGEGHEIEHERLNALTGMYPAYGWITKILKRPLDYCQK